MKKKIERLIKSQIEIKIIFIAVAVLFIWFLAAPIILLLLKSFQSTGGDFWVHYVDVFTENGFWTAVGNSFKSAGLSAVVTTMLAFVLAYTVHYTNLPKPLKKLIHGGAVLPMLLPTIPYGFAVIYSFGKQGLITRLLGHQLFDIYKGSQIQGGFKSVAYSITFRAKDRTLEDKEVGAVMEKILHGLREMKIELRA